MLARRSAYTYVCAYTYASSIYRVYTYLQTFGQIFIPSVISESREILLDSLLTCLIEIFLVVDRRLSFPSEGRGRQREREREIERGEG